MYFLFLWSHHLIIVIYALKVFIVIRRIVTILRCVSGSNLEPMAACHEISAIISSYNTFLLTEVNFNADNMFLWFSKELNFT